MSEPRWEADEDFPYDDIRWTHEDHHISKGTLEVDSTSSNTFGPPIYLRIQRGSQDVGIWLDLDTWEAMYQAGLKCHDQRIQMTEDGWT